MQSKQDNIDLIVNDIKSNFVKEDGTSRAKLEFTIADNEDSLTFESEAAIKNETDTDVKKLSVSTENVENLQLSDKNATDSKQLSETDKAQSKEETAKIWTTYIPRFTEISDSYRMADSQSSPNEVPTKKLEAKKLVQETEAVNPTSENEDASAIEDAKIVNVSAPMPETYDMQTKVFKFEDSNGAQNAETNEAEVSELNFEETIEDFSEDSNEVADDDLEMEEKIVPKEYTIDSIPDPESEQPVERGLIAPKKNVAVTVPENIGDPLAEVKRPNSEYSSFSGRDGFKDRFLDTIMSVKVRLFVALFISCIIAVFETVVAFGVDLSSKLGFSAVGGSLAIIEAMLITGLLVIALPEVVLSIRTLATGRAVPELFLPLSYIILFVYYLVVASKSAESYSLFGFLFAIIVLAAIVGEFLKKSADFLGFKMISVAGEKKVVDRKLTRTLPEESLAVDGKVEGYKSKIARVFRASFVADFFKRSKKCSENSKNIAIIFSVAFGVSLVCSLVAFFVLDGILSLLNTFSAVFMLAIPAISILSHKIPFFHAQKEAVSESSAVIGEVSLYDYSGVDVIAFSDTEIFGEDDVNLQRIMLYGRSENLTKALVQMSALFSVVGGPLDRIFADSLDHRATPAQSVIIEENGIFGIVSGKNVYAGSLDFMQKNGINVPYDPTPDNANLLSTKIMYAAEDGEVYAKFYIRYTLSEDFTMILPSLSDDAVTPLVYTRDPNVNNELFKVLTAGSDKIRVLKKTNIPVGEDKLYQKISAGIVTNGEKNNVINALLLCKKYARFQSRIAVTELLSTVVGATLAIVLALSGITVFPSVVLGAWQLAWCAVLYFISRRTFNPTLIKELK